jgi:hypothetical protein
VYYYVILLGTGIENIHTNDVLAGSALSLGGTVHFDRRISDTK